MEHRVHKIRTLRLFTLQFYYFFVTEGLMDRLRTIPTRQSLELRAEVSTWFVHRICLPLRQVLIKKCWLIIFHFIYRSGGFHGLRFEEPEMHLAGKDQQNIRIWCPCLNCTVCTFPLIEPLLVLPYNILWTTRDAHFDSTKFCFGF